MLDRRAFLSCGAAVGSGLLLSHMPPGLRAAAVNLSAGLDEDWLYAGISQLQALMVAGQLTSRELTQAYLNRIGNLNPVLHAVIETNPDAVATAARLDNERRAGRVRGPLHGIPVLVKDNIATADRMQTTAGSLALLNAKVPGGAPLTAGLRRAGAVILGKANLSEWANFRGFPPFNEELWFPLNGWSARGGFTSNPYDLGFDPGGSSSGSAVGSAVALCGAAVGTETDGSIVVPSTLNHAVGLKPTVGLISQQGIIPIAHSQDTAGPITRTVTDAALVLAAMQQPFGGYAIPGDYTPFLRRGALRGARIGVDWRYFTPDYGGEPERVAVANAAIDVMRSLGAVIVDGVDTGDQIQYWDAEFTVMLYEFKQDIAAYLGTLSHSPMRTVLDLMAFNLAHCRQEMKYYGQEIWEMSAATTDLSDPIYVDARATCIQLSRAEGIDAALAKDNLDAIVAPGLSFATHAAVAGYPNLSLPVGLLPNGRPASIYLYAGFLQEARLLALAYDLEQELGARARPALIGSPVEWPDAALCANSPKPNNSRRGLPHGRREW